MLELDGITELLELGVSTTVTDITSVVVSGSCVMICETVTGATLLEACSYMSMVYVSVQQSKLRYVEPSVAWNRKAVQQIGLTCGLREHQNTSVCTKGSAYDLPVNRVLRCNRSTILVGVGRIRTVIFARCESAAMIQVYSTRCCLSAASPV